VIGAIDVRALGLAVIALGGGRQRPTDPIDHAVGLTEVRGIGEAVGPDRPFAVIHARSEASAEAVSAGIAAAVTVAEAPAAPPAQAIVARIGTAPDSECQGT
jgi:thymidine phosphorylase